MKGLIATLFVLLITGSAFSVEWSELGLYEVSVSKNNKMSFINFEDANKRAFTVATGEEVSDMLKNKVVELKNMFYDIGEMTIRELKFIIYEGQIEIFIMPDTLTINNKDYSSHITSGLYFVWDGTLRYDFRMVKERLRLRVKGYYAKKSELFDKITRAIESPKDFIEVAEPEYILERLIQLEQVVMEMKSQNTRLKEELDYANKELDKTKKEFELTKKQLLRADQEIIADLEATKKETKKEFNEVRKVQTEMAQHHLQDSDKIRRAIANLMNRNFFGFIVPIPNETVNHVISIKKNHPEWKLKEVIEQMRSEKSTASDWEIYLTMAIYLSEFQQ